MATSASKCNKIKNTFNQINAFLHQLNQNLTTDCTDLFYTNCSEMKKTKTKKKQAQRNFQQKKSH